LGSAPTAHGRQETGVYLRSATVLIVIGVLGTTLAQPQTLAHLVLRNLLKNQLHVSRAANAAFFFWIGLAWYFKPIFGILTDAFPLFGSRRKSYLIAGASLAALSWVVLFFTPHQYSKLLWACIAINVFMVATSTVVGGYMVEAAQASSGSGRLTSVRNLAEQLCLLIIGPAGGFLAGIAFGWTAGACACAILLVVPGTMLLLREPHDPVRSQNVFKDAVKQLGTFVTAKTMWAAAGFMALFYFAPGIATALFYKQQNELHFTTQTQGLLQLLGGLFGVAGAAFYGAFACRRYRFRTLLLWCMALAVAADVGYLFYSSLSHAEFIEGFNGFAYTLAEVALMDLAVRATPRGSEGLGFSLMMSVRNFALLGSDWIGAKLLEAYHLQFSTLVIANGATTLIAIPLVLLLPAMILKARDAQPVILPPALDSVSLQAQHN
jgi:predicted MFS family arabinose efflux permease